MKQSILTDRDGGDRRWAATALLVAALAAIPMVVALASLVSPGDVAWAHLRDTNLAVYLANTAGLMVLVGAFAAVIGVSTAWLVAMCEFPGRRLFSLLLVLPLAAPAYIVAYFYTDLLAFAGPVQNFIRETFQLNADVRVLPNIRNLPGAAVMLGLVLYPYVYLLARTAFSAQSASQFLAARTLGLNPRQAFFRVVAPGARPAIAGGLALVLMETLADFGVADYFAVPTFSTGIFRTWLAMGEKLAALKLAGVMLVFVMALIALEALSRRGRVDSAGRTPSAPERMRLNSGHSVIAIAICAAPVLFGFLLPVVGLLLLTVGGGDQMLGRGFLDFAKNSVVVAVFAGVVATFLAVLLSYAQRQSSSLLTKGAIRLSTLGYALPGALLAVGLLGPIGGVDRAATRFASTYLGWNGGLLFTGTIAILVYACVIRFLTVSFNSVSGALSKISPTIDDAARSLGAGPGAVIRRIHIPLIRPGLAAGGLLVFVDVMRELPATLILRPFNFETLATRVYRLASDERLAEASTAALAIVLIGLVPILILNRFSEKNG